MEQTIRSRTSKVLLLTAMGCICGCATLVKQGEPTFTLSSEPTGAKVLVGGVEVGTTPYTHTHQPGKPAETEFQVQMPGYVATTVTKTAVPNKAAYFGSAILFNIPSIFDRRNPDLWSYPVHEVHVDLLKELDVDLPSVTVPMTEFENGLGTSPQVGRLNGQPIKGVDAIIFGELEYPDVLGSALQRGLRDTWLEVPTARLVTRQGKDLLDRHKVFAKPQLRRVDADLVGRRGRLNGPILVEVAWRFYSGTKRDSMLFEVPVVHTHHAVNTSYTTVLEEACEASARKLLDEPGLHERLKGMHESAVAMSKGGVVAIDRPKPIPFLGRKDMLSALINAVVTVEVEDGHGSGFLISNTGHIITNHHVVGDQTTVKVKFNQGLTLDVEVLKTNPDFDLALLKANVTDVPALTAGDDAGLLVGEELFAIGTPLASELGQSVSRGILSGKRTINEHQYLQTDVSINPGNSGGPLIDETGKVVGVATMKISGKGLEGLGFGVPISVALEMLNIDLKP